MVKSLRDRIIDNLISVKKISKDQLSEVTKLQTQTGQRFESILLEKKIITQKELLSVMSKETNVACINIDNYEIDGDLLTLVSERICKQYNVFPLAKIGNILTVAILDPLNIFALDDLKSMTGFEISVILATQEDISKAIQAGYHELKSSEVEDLVEQIKDEDINVITAAKDSEGNFDIDKSVLESEESSIVKLVNLILVEALRKRASDIHIEPEYEKLRVRFRIDGVLHDLYNIPKKNQAAVLARIKIMSRLDITEFRIPQDGRFKIRLSEKEVDFRVSVLPITFGEKIVLRLLDKSNLSIGLDKLGFLDEPVALFKEAISKPFGMILVTGPTGSGKSTTLYSIINQMNKPDAHIITIEDPVEYQIEGIAQVQVKPDVGLTFASGLRSLLRQSPDVILIGEIRDAETADIAVKAALTGQLVLSTLHTNDACGAITRLIDMGVEPFLVSSSLIMACAQRLSRQICKNCKEEYKPDQEALSELGLKDKGSVFYRGRGCSVCNKSGYRGRVGTLEVLMLDDTIKEMIIKKVSTEQIKEYAIKKGMEDLRANGIRQAMMGLTSLEEVIRITTED